MKNFLWILVSLMVLASCHQTEYMVEGNSTIQTMDGKKLYLKAYKDDDLVDIDSATWCMGSLILSVHWIPS